MAPAKREVSKATKKSREMIPADIIELPVVLIKSKYYVTTRFSNWRTHSSICTGRMQNKNIQYICLKHQVYYKIWKNKYFNKNHPQNGRKE